VGEGASGRSPCKRRRDARFLVIECSRLLLIWRLSLATELLTADVPAVARLRDDVGPPGAIPGGFSFSGGMRSRAPSLHRWARRPSSSPDPPSVSRYGAIEPQGRPARLNLDGAGACPRGMMLILKYFLVVGAVLTMGLIALNAHLLPAGSTAPAALHSATSASLPTVAPKVQPAEPEPAVEASPPPPAKSATPSHRSQRSARAHRRSH
jgi:hypothetical protein